MSDTEAKDSEGESDDSDTAVTVSEAGNAGCALASTLTKQVQETADFGKLPHPKVRFLFLKFTFSSEKTTSVVLCLAGTVTSTVDEAVCPSEGKASFKVFRNGIKED